MFINVHTHHPVGSGIEIENWDIRNPDFCPTATYYSAGIHPWWIEEVDVVGKIECLKNILNQSNCLAIGEVGMDKFATAELKLQQNIFKWQLELANEFHKPVILHVVRSHQEIVDIFHQRKCNIPFIFHGFNGNMSIATTLVKEDFYFSLGGALLNKQSNAAVLLKTMDLKYLFFENDDLSSPIENIYYAASEILNVKIDDLCAIVEENFEKVFHK